MAAWVAGGRARLPDAVVPLGTAARADPDRLLVGAFAALIGILYLPTGFLVEQFPVPTYYVTCTADCPANALTLLASTPAWITDGVIPVREAITVLLTALIAWRLAYRLGHATRLMRRTLLPVFICAIVRVISLGTWIVLRRAGDRRRRKRAPRGRHARAEPAAHVARIPRGPAQLAAVRGRRAPAARAAAARRALHRGAAQRDRQGCHGPLARARVPPAARRGRLGHRRRLAGAAAPGRPRPRGHS